MANPPSNPLSKLGNDPLEDKPPPRASSRRELRELRKKEKKVGGGLEKPEVRCDSHLFQRGVILTPLQRGRRQTKREEEEIGTSELKNPYVRDPHLFRHEAF